MAIVESIQIDKEKKLLHINLTVDQQVIENLTPYLDEKALKALVGRPSAFLHAYNIQLASHQLLTVTRAFDCSG
ncbi:hypothetical protein [Latilactobacillus fuchuensis]|uniref:hypothetical protein n=1 Tax=Latilactobacillus fuchuensis TaxID=164393 RepID=UPI0039AF9E09